MSAAKGMPLPAHSRSRTTPGPTAAFTCPRAARHATARRRSLPAVWYKTNVMERPCGPCAARKQQARGVARERRPGLTDPRAETSRDPQAPT